MAQQIAPAPRPRQRPPRKFRPEHASAIAREVVQRIAAGGQASLAALPPDHPRRRPTLPRLKFLERDDGDR